MILEFLQCLIRFASGLFAYVLLSTFVGPTQAETPTRPRRDRGGRDSSRGSTEDYRPFLFADASGKVEGIDVSMVMSLANSLREAVREDVGRCSTDLEVKQFEIADGGIMITFYRYKWIVDAFERNTITRRGDETKIRTIVAI